MNLYSQLVLCGDGDLVPIIAWGLHRRIPAAGRPFVYTPVYPRYVPLWGSTPRWVEIVLVLGVVVLVLEHLMVLV